MFLYILLYVLDDENRAFFITICFVISKQHYLGYKQKFQKVFPRFSRESWREGPTEGKVALRILIWLMLNESWMTFIMETLDFSGFRTIFDWFSDLHTSIMPSNLSYFWNHCIKSTDLFTFFAVLTVHFRSTLN